MLNLDVVEVKNLIYICNNVTILNRLDREYIVVKKKTPKKLPEKLSNVLKVIKECIKKNSYVFCEHALDRVIERGIDIPTVLKILQTGYEEKKKDRFDLISKVWRYAIRGKAVEVLEEVRELDIRIIVVIEEDGMVIITVMHVLEDNYE
ncbi:MAG: hypothetical protein JWO53_115 [Chlamydiia bacterium]|nr:hypothetical protein [Chlamydiia bacterium]